jgi:hypothetical protein
MFSIRTDSKLTPGTSKGVVSVVVEVPGRPPLERDLSPDEARDLARGLLAAAAAVEIESELYSFLRSRVGQRNAVALLHDLAWHRELNAMADATPTGRPV